MGWFANLFGKEKVEPAQRDYSNRAVPDPHTPEGKAPYIDAWTGYSSRKSGDPLKTIGREPRQVPGEYPASEQFTREQPMYKTAVPQEMYERPRSPDPRWVATTPIRPQRSQSTFRTVNPFDWQFTRRLDGRHFSMASHIRTYRIGGMKPVTSRRNTYRLLPPPRDMAHTNLPASGTAFNVSDMDTRGVSVEGRSPMARLGR